MSADRVERVRSRMGELGVDVLLLSLGADLPWLTGYEAHESERLTMLVLPREGDATMVVPALEEPKVAAVSDVATRPWTETEDPVAIVASLAGPSARSVAVSDRTWAMFVLALQAAMPAATLRPSSTVVAPLRARKDAAELDALRRASAAADAVAGALLRGEISMIGRREVDVSAEIAQRLRDEGHTRVGFSIVGSGPNAASPHHDAGERVIAEGESVVCDFGGWFGDGGYCSDITRTVFTGDPPAEFVELYGVLQQAQAAGVAAATVGTPCEDVDRAARSIIDDAGYGDYFIHRTGHGIGLEVHEHPYLVRGNDEPLAPGNAFSVEPGIYVPGRWGARIEDIVVATDAGPTPLNAADHDLHVVEA
ncbi:MAG TPA: Xaa-Pro peptidase family protein [Acidimicrobiales bacterium]|nr:Xaa-Pro peptidase family protein [Acidimicrobiales bacterium]